MPGRLSQRLLGTRPSLYESLIQQGLSTAPIGHWTQGLARLAQAYVGSRGLQDLEKKSAEQDAALQKTIMEAFGPVREKGPDYQGPVQPVPEDLKSFGEADQERFLGQSGTQFGLPEAPMVERDARTMEIAQRLAQNPETQDLATQLMMKAAASREAAERDAEARKAGMADWRTKYGIEREGERADTAEAREYKRGQDQEKFARDAALLNYKAELGITGDMDPSDVRTYKYMMSLPEEQRAGFLATLRNPGYLNLGGQYGLPDPMRPGKLAGTVEKTVPPEKQPGFVGDTARQKEIGKATGAAVGEAQAGLPDLIAKTDYTMDLIDKAINHPGMPDVVGMPDNPLALKGLMPGTPAADFRALHKQLAGGTFLQAFESLKGGGHITEIEGQKGQEAMARMDTAQSEKAYINALNEFKQVLKNGVIRAERKAGLPSSRGEITIFAKPGETPRRRKGDPPPGFEVQQ